MDARSYCCFLAIALCVPCLGASHRTTNFVVTAPTSSLAREIGVSAEKYRHDLAIEWLNRELPRWSDPCPIKANVNPRLGAGGVTSFTFYNRRPSDWNMSVQGSRERVLDSVLPHEVTHTIFATHFGQPLPRWADEGACTTVEHVSEQKKQEDWLLRFISQRRGIPFNRMFAMKQYPRDLLPLYAQGYSVAEYLIQQGGKRKFVQFVGDGLATENWHASLQKFYQYEKIADLQLAWERWLGAGRPRLKSPGDDILLVSTTENDRKSDSSSRLTSTRPRIQRKDDSEGSWYAKVSDGSVSPTALNPRTISRMKAGETQRTDLDSVSKGTSRKDTKWQSIRPDSRRRFLR